jgi:hypothetical protein
MIRHVSVMTLKDGADARQLVRALDQLRERVKGPTAMTYGVDAGLKTGNAAFATCVDFADEAAFRTWDTDAEHERIRKEQVFPIISGIQRCQFRVG